MTIQEAAHDILNELGKPVSSKKLSRIALDRRMVTSVAKDPVQSHAQTIEKNIQDDIYNQPKLKNNFDETVTLILSKGFASLAPEIKKGLMQQLDSLETFNVADRTSS